MAATSSRRTFLGLAAAFVGAALSGPLGRMPLAMAEDDIVIVGGWVLLRSDLGKLPRR